MKIIGVLMCGCALVWALLAFNMDVSVKTKAETIGSGVYSIDVPSVTVNNLGLMDQRRNHLMGSGVLFIAGVILAALSVRSGVSVVGGGSRRACPYCAESISGDAIICRFCQKEVPSVTKEKRPLAQAPAMSASGPKSIRYCPKCTAMNDGAARECFRCAEVLPTD